MTSGSTELDEVTRMKTTSVSRRRLRIRRLKYTCRTKTEIAITSSKNGESSSDTHLCVKKTRMVGKEEGLLGESSSTDSIREISLSLSSSLGRASEPKNGIVLSGFGDQARDDSRGLTCGSHGWVSVIGRRREMEDAVKVELGFALVRNEKYDFFGVYDGHGGARVAEACRERLHRVLEEEMMVVEGEKGKYGRIDWERAMLGGFERMDEEVIETGRIDGSVNMIGSTAVVAVVGKEVVVVANCGDSRAVISRGGVSVALSADHKEGLYLAGLHLKLELAKAKPDRVDELERIESAGGRVINWSGHRVLGVLATSRSIGDQYLKPFIISKPEVTISERTDADEFLILASDGLWDVVSNEAACQVVRRCFKEHVRNEYLEFFPDQCAAEAASVLAELAMARGSRDNVSVIVIGLKKPSLCS